MSLFCIWKSTSPGTVCWGDFSFHVEWTWHTCWKSVGHGRMDFQTLNSIPLVYINLTLCLCHNDLSVIVCSKFWNWQVRVLNFFFFCFFSVVWLFRVPRNSYELKDKLFHFLKKSHWSFGRNCFESIFSFSPVSTFKTVVLKSLCSNSTVRPLQGLFCSIN